MTTDLPADRQPDDQPDNPPDNKPEDLGDHYARSRARVTALLAAAGEAAMATPVAACPGWTVHDVVAHLVGVIEDAAAGRIRGIPDAAQTDEQVQRHRSESSADLLATWDALAPMFQQAVSANAIWPAMLDALSHEHDIRTALGVGGARDIDSVRIAATRLASSIELDGDASISVLIDGAAASAGPEGTNAYELRTNAFEVLRFRLGRRSIEQVSALDWSRDPSPILDQLFIFGPAAHALDESAHAG